MNFCSQCGSNKIVFTIPAGDHLQRFVCQNCETIHYQNPNLVVGAIATHQGKILLAKRDIEPRKGFWNLPCGFLENDETVEEGAVREVLEETGAMIHLGELHTVFNLPNVNQIYMIFRATMLNDHFHKTPESAEVKLVDPNDIPWDEIAFESNRFALERYVEDLERGFIKTHLGTFRHQK